MSKSWRRREEIHGAVAGRAVPHRVLAYRVTGYRRLLRAVEDGNDVDAIRLDAVAHKRLGRAPSATTPSHALDQPRLAAQQLLDFGRR